MAANAIQNQTGTMPYVPTCNQISKHRMVLFIQKRIYDGEYGTAFQNIVCYCLSKRCCCWHYHCCISKHRMLLFIDGIWIYRGCLPHFKTSYVTVYHGWHNLKNTMFSHFKTSYVTVYLLFFSLCIFLNLHFKTSYVTVYPVSAAFTALSSPISKHRMLLFI